MQLFRPDNFSEPDITFKVSSAEDCAAVSGALARYFKACTVTAQQQLNAAEIHSNNFKVTLRTHFTSTPEPRCEECARDARRAEDAVAPALQQRQATPQLAHTPATRRDTADCPHRGVASPRSIAVDTPSEIASGAAGQSASITARRTFEMGSRRRVSKTVLVRRFRSLKNKEQIAFYLNIIDGLRLQGVAVSEVLRADDGALFVSHDGDHYAVFAFVEGDHFVPNDESMAAVAGGVSGMHRAFRLLGADAAEQLMRYQASGGSDYFNKIKTYSEGDVDEIAAALASGAARDAADTSAAQEALPLLRGAMQYVEGYKERIARLPKHVIHSDLHPHNVLMRGNELRAIIDFDSMRVSEQARDAAFFIYRFGRQFFVRGGVQHEKIKSEAARVRDLALQAYTAVQPLSSEELALMPVLLKDEMIRKNLFVLKGVFLESNTQWAKDLPKFFASLKEIDYFW